MDFIKKTFLILIAIAIIIYGAVHNYWQQILLGVILLAMLLFVKGKILVHLITIYIKKQYGIDILEEVKQEVSSELIDKYPNLPKKFLENIDAANTLNAASTAVSQIILSEEKCPNCGSENISQIEWDQKFNKYIDEKEQLASDPLAFKCSVCKKKYFRWLTN